MEELDVLKNLQENLAKDLVRLEQSSSVTTDELHTITDVYSKVYDLITVIKSL